MTLMKFISLFVFRNIREEKFLTLLSVIGIALGTGLFTGVKIASDRAVASFEAKVQGLGPSAGYLILDRAGIDFDENVYGQVLKIEEDAVPSLRTTGYIPAISESIDIEGIYTARGIRSLKASPGKRVDIEAFYRQENGVMITRALSDKYGLKKGSEIRALVYNREYPLLITDVLDSESLLPGIAVMDIGNFQEYFDKTGYLSRIDLPVNAEKADEIRKILPPRLSIEKTEGILSNQRAVVRSFRYNTEFISLVAVLVGLFLLYNTVFLSVVKRRREIGILRGLGIARKTVVVLFMVHGMLLGIAGSVMGIAVGQVAAYFSALAIGRTISSIYGGVSIADYAVRQGDALRALLLGLSVALLASAIPAYEAAKIKPNESLRPGSFEGRYRAYQKYLSIAGCSGIAIGISLSCLDYFFMPFGFPFLAYGGILSLIAGFTLLSPSYLSIMLRLFRGTVERIFGPTGKIAMGDMRGNIYRFSVALMSVAVSCALVIALFTLIFSFRKSLVLWIERTIAADVYVKPASCVSNFCSNPLPDDIVPIIERFPEVKGVDRFRSLDIELFGRRVIAGFADLEAQRKFSPLHGDGERRERAGTLERSRMLSVSHYLSMQYGLKKGDTIELPTARGKVGFTIYDTFTSYSTASGFIFMDRKWLKEYWGLDDATQVSVYLKEGADPDLFVRKLREKVAGKYALEILNNHDLRGKVLSIFQRSFAVTYAIELISLVVSLIGVVNTLLAFVLERKREISIIRYLGGSWTQIRQVLVLSAGVVGITGILMGAVIGPVMSMIFIRVINEISFGWRVDFSTPVLYLSFVGVVLFLTTLLAGYLPSRVAEKIDPKRHISFE